MWAFNKISCHISPSTSYYIEGPPWVVIPFLSVYPSISLYHDMIYLDWKFRIIFQIKLLGTGWLGTTTFTWARIWPVCSNKHYYLKMCWIYTSHTFKHIKHNDTTLSKNPQNPNNRTTSQQIKHLNTNSNRSMCPAKWNKSTRSVWKSCMLLLLNFYFKPWHSLGYSQDEGPFFQKLWSPSHHPLGLATATSAGYSIPQHMWSYADFHTAKNTVVGWHAASEGFGTGKKGKQTHTKNNLNDKQQSRDLGVTTLEVPVAPTQGSSTEAVAVCVYTCVYVYI